MLRPACIPNAPCLQSGPVPRLLILAVAALLAGCAVDGSMLTTDKFLVSVKAAQFYKYGPAQAFGSDFNLPEGQKVTMLQRQFGYSRIMLEDGTSGYVATEELKPAPPDPPPRPTPKSKSRSGWFSSGKPNHGSVEFNPADPLFDINDVPLPMSDTPADNPAPKPEFRHPRPQPGFRY